MTQRSAAGFTANLQEIGAMQVGGVVLGLGKPGVLFTLAGADAPAHDQRVFTLTTPVFEVNGVERGDWTLQSVQFLRVLPHNGQEHLLRYATRSTPALQLEVTICSHAHSPFLRFRYALRAPVPVTLTKNTGHDNIRYFAAQGWDAQRAHLHIIQLSHFDPVTHSYMPASEHHTPAQTYDKQAFVGPIAILEADDTPLLCAYEHGADHPNGFLRFTLHKQGAPALELRALKGNYHAGQTVSDGEPFTSVWFEVGTRHKPGGDFLPRYRKFFLEEAAENVTSRKPYVYYNTWNHQERKKYFEGKPYLTDMRLTRMMQEIDAAHKIGIDVFVIDTGWYGKTGDWLVNLDRFPDGLHQIKVRLDSYGMRLGLWFNPTVAARTSEIYVQHPEYVMERDGKPNFWGPIWETEESYGLCLASGYADHFIETLVRLHRELGVTYFKWDAIGQYGCDSLHHNHGTGQNTAQERADCYAYESGRQMIRIVEEVSKRCPDIIVDFDVTEGGRFMGLGFLSVGKYFLINNGPYFHDFDIPNTTKISPDTINVFFYPGPARSRICRQGVKYDSVIPSILFLTHYLPDGPPLSQRNALASLALGGSGLWGDLVGLSDADIAFWAEGIGDYKRVRDAVTRAYPRQIGFAGSSPEIHEKIDPAAASGLVAFFSVAACEAVHVTQPIASEHLLDVKGARSWDLLPDRRVKLTVSLERSDARIVTLFAREAQAKPQDTSDTKAD